MATGVVRERPMRSAELAPLEPGALAAAERFRSIALMADAPDTGRAARHMAWKVTGDWGLTAITYDVELCVSELVGNAVDHAIPDGRR